MDKVLIVFLGALGIAMLLFVGIILSTLFGGIAGWVVGMVFPFVTDTIRELSGYNSPDKFLTDFQIGAILGFVGSFLKTSVSTSK